jgi:hypothetical protein
MCRPPLSKQPRAAASMLCRPTLPTATRARAYPPSFLRVALDQAGPPHSSLVPPPRTRRFEDAADTSFHSFPRPPLELKHPHPPTALRAHEASRATDTTPLSTGFETDVIARPSQVSRGSVPPCSNWSHALIPPFTPVQLLRTPKITGAAPPPEHYHPEPTPPPRCRTAASVRPHRSHHTWHLPLFLRKLSLPVSPHLITRLDTTGRASLPLRAWPLRGDHG